MSTEITTTSNYQLTNSKQDKEIRKLSLQLFDSGKTFKNIKDNYEAERQSIQEKLIDFIHKKNIHKVSFNVGNTDYEFQNVQQTKIIFNPNDLEKKLDKSVSRQVIRKEYTIADYEGLVKYLKSCGVNPKEFAKYLSVEKSVDLKKINQLSEIGVITEEDLKGTYTVSKNTGYIKMTESKSEE